MNGRQNTNVLSIARARRPRRTPAADETPPVAPRIELSPDQGAAPAISAEDLPKALGAEYAKTLYVSAPPRWRTPPEVAALDEEARAAGVDMRQPPMEFKRPRQITLAPTPPEIAKLETRLDTAQIVDESITLAQLAHQTFNTIVNNPERRRIAECVAAYKTKRLNWPFLKMHAQMAEEFAASMGPVRKQLARALLQTGIGQIGGGLIDSCWRALTNEDIGPVGLAAVAFATGKLEPENWRQRLAGGALTLTARLAELRAINGLLGGLAPQLWARLSPRARGGITFLASELTRQTGEKLTGVRRQYDPTALAAEWLTGYYLNGPIHGKAYATTREQLLTGKVLPHAERLAELNTHVLKKVFALELLRLGFDPEILADEVLFDAALAYGFHLAEFGQVFGMMRVQELLERAGLNREEARWLSLYAGLQANKAGAARSFIFFTRAFAPSKQDFAMIVRNWHEYRAHPGLMFGGPVPAEQLPAAEMHRRIMTGETLARLMLMTPPERWRFYEGYAQELFKTLHKELDAAELVMRPEDAELYYASAMGKDNELWRRMLETVTRHWNFTGAPTLLKALKETPPPYPQFPIPDGVQLIIRHPAAHYRLWKSGQQWHAECTTPSGAPLDRVIVIRPGSFHDLFLEQVAAKKIYERYVRQPAALASADQKLDAQVETIIKQAGEPPPPAPALEGAPGGKHARGIGTSVEAPRPETGAGGPPPPSPGRELGAGDRSVRVRDVAENRLGAQPAAPTPAGPERRVIGLLPAPETDEGLKLIRDVREFLEQYGGAEKPVPRDELVDIITRAQEYKKDVVQALEADLRAILPARYEKQLGQYADAAFRMMIANLLRLVSHQPLAPVAGESFDEALERVSSTLKQMPEKIPPVGPSRFARFEPPSKPERWRPPTEKTPKGLRWAETLDDLGRFVIESLARDARTRPFVGKVSDVKALWRLYQAYLRGARPEAPLVVAREEAERLRNQLASSQPDLAQRWENLLRQSEALDYYLPAPKDLVAETLRHAPDKRLEIYRLYNALSRAEQLGVTPETLAESFRDVERAVAEQALNKSWRLQAQKNLPEPPVPLAALREFALTPPSGGRRMVLLGLSPSPATEQALESFKEAQLTILPAQPTHAPIWAALLGEKSMAGEIAPVGKLPARYDLLLGYVPYPELLSVLEQLRAAPPPPEAEVALAVIGPERLSREVGQALAESAFLVQRRAAPGGKKLYLLRKLPEAGAFEKVISLAQAPEVLRRLVGPELYGLIENAAKEVLSKPLWAHFCLQLALGKYPLPEQSAEARALALKISESLEPANRLFFNLLAQEEPCVLVGPFADPENLRGNPEVKKLLAPPAGLNIFPAGQRDARVGTFAGKEVYLLKIRDQLGFYLFDLKPWNDWTLVVLRPLSRLEALELRGDPQLIQRATALVWAENIKTEPDILEQLDHWANRTLSEDLKRISEELAKLPTEAERREWLRKPENDAALAHFARITSARVLLNPNASPAMHIAAFVLYFNSFGRSALGAHEALMNAARKFLETKLDSSLARIPIFSQIVISEWMKCVLAGRLTEPEALPPAFWNPRVWRMALDEYLRLRNLPATPEDWAALPAAWSENIPHYIAARVRRLLIRPVIAPAEAREIILALDNELWLKLNESAQTSRAPPISLAPRAKEIPADVAMECSGDTFNNLTLYLPLEDKLRLAQLSRAARLPPDKYEEFERLLNIARRHREQAMELLFLTCLSLRDKVQDSPLQVLDQLPDAIAEVAANGQIIVADPRAPAARLIFEPVQGLLPGRYFVRPGGYLTPDRNTWETQLEVGAPAPVGRLLVNADSFAEALRVLRKTNIVGASPRLWLMRLGSELFCALADAAGKPSQNGARLPLLGSEGLWPEKLPYVLNIPFDIFERLARFCQQNLLRIGRAPEAGRLESCLLDGGSFQFASYLEPAQIARVDVSGWRTLDEIRRAMPAARPAEPEVMHLRVALAADTPDAVRVEQNNVWLQFVTPFGPVVARCAPAPRQLPSGIPSGPIDDALARQIKRGARAVLGKLPAAVNAFFWDWAGHFDRGSGVHAAIWATPDECHVVLSAHGRILAARAIRDDISWLYKPLSLVIPDGVWQLLGWCAAQESLTIAGNAQRVILRAGNKVAVALANSSGHWPAIQTALPAPTGVLGQALARLKTSPRASPLPQIVIPGNLLRALARIAPYGAVTIEPVGEDLARLIVSIEASRFALLLPASPAPIAPWTGALRALSPAADVFARQASVILQIAPDGGAICKTLTGDMFVTAHSAFESSTPEIKTHVPCALLLDVIGAAMPTYRISCLFHPIVASHVYQHKIPPGWYGLRLPDGGLLGAFDAEGNVVTPWINMDSDHLDALAYAALYATLRRQRLPADVESELARFLGGEAVTLNAILRHLEKIPARALKKALQALWLAAQPNNAYLSRFFKYVKPTQVGALLTRMRERLSLLELSNIRIERGQTAARPPETFWRRLQPSDDAIELYLKKIAPDLEVFARSLSGRPLGELIRMPTKEEARRSWPSILLVAFWTARFPILYAFTEKGMRAENWPPGFSQITGATFLGGTYVLVECAHARHAGFQLKRGMDATIHELLHVFIDMGDPVLNELLRHIRAKSKLYQWHLRAGVPPELARIEILLEFICQYATSAKHMEEIFSFKTQEEYARCAEYCQFYIRLINSSLRHAMRLHHRFAKILRGEEPIKFEKVVKRGPHYRQMWLTYFAQQAPVMAADISGHIRPYGVSDAVKNRIVSDIRARKGEAIARQAALAFARNKTDVGLVASLLNITLGLPPDTVSVILWPTREKCVACGPVMAAATQETIELLARQQAGPEVEIYLYSHLEAGEYAPISAPADVLRLHDRETIYVAYKLPDARLAKEAYEALRRWGFITARYSCDADTVVGFRPVSTIDPAGVWDGLAKLSGMSLRDTFIKCGYGAALMFGREALATLKPEQISGAMAVLRKARAVPLVEILRAISRPTATRKAFHKKALSDEDWLAFLAQINPKAAKAMQAARKKQGEKKTTGATPRGATRDMLESYLAHMFAERFGAQPAAERGALLKALRDFAAQCHKYTNQERANALSALLNEHGMPRLAASIRRWGASVVFARRLLNEAERQHASLVRASLINILAKSAPAKVKQYAEAISHQISDILSKIPVHTDARGQLMPEWSALTVDEWQNVVEQLEAAHALQAALETAIRENFDAAIKGLVEKCVNELNHIEPLLSASEVLDGRRLSDPQARWRWFLRRIVMNAASLPDLFRMFGPPGGTWHLLARLLTRCSQKAAELDLAITEKFYATLLEKMRVTKMDLHRLAQQRVKLPILIEGQPWVITRAELWLLAALLRRQDTARKVLANGIVSGPPGLGVIVRPASPEAATAFREAIDKALTNIDRFIIDEAFKAFREMADAMNRVSMRATGQRIATLGPWYVPSKALWLEVPPLLGREGGWQVPSVSSLDFLKETLEHNRPLLLRHFLDVFDRYMREAARYCAYYELETLFRALLNEPYEGRRAAVAEMLVARFGPGVVRKIMEQWGRITARRITYSVRLESLSRNVGVSILGASPTSYLRNRLAFIFYGAMLEGIAPGWGLKYLAFYGGFPRSLRTARARELLRKMFTHSAYLRRRWEPAVLIAGNLLASYTGVATGTRLAGGPWGVGALTAQNRMMQARLLAHLARGEARAAAALYDFLTRRGWPEDQAAYLVESITRATQNSGDETDDSALLARVRELGWGGFLPFAAQHGAVATTFWRLWINAYWLWRGAPPETEPLRMEPLPERLRMGTEPFLSEFLTDLDWRVPDVLPKTLTRALYALLMFLAGIAINALAETAIRRGRQWLARTEPAKVGPLAFTGSRESPYEPLVDWIAFATETIESTVPVSQLVLEPLAHALALAAHKRGMVATPIHILETPLQMAFEAVAHAFRAVLRRDQPEAPDYILRALSSSLRAAGSFMGWPVQTARFVYLASKNVFYPPEEEERQKKLERQRARRYEPYWRKRKRRFERELEKKREALYEQTQP